MSGGYFFSKMKPSLFIVPRIPGQIPDDLKLLQLTKPWMRLKVFEGESFASRLPDHYKHFYWLWKHGEKTPVHFDPESGSFKLDKETGNVVPVKNEGVQVLYPDQVNEGLWGGEGVIKGYVHIGRYKGESAKYWFPSLYMSVVYSEVLNNYMEVAATERCLTLIDRHYGLDSYLLENTYADINSVLGFKIKREILLALANQTLYSDNQKMREEMTEKYKKFMVSADEADWIGLPLDEACKKQEKLEAKVVPFPLKDEFRRQLLQYLKDNPAALQKSDEESADSKSSSWLKKLNPFGKS